MPYSHISAAVGTRLLPVKLLGELALIKLRLLQRCCVLAVGVPRASIEVLRLPPYFVKILSAVRARLVGLQLGDVRLLLSLLKLWEELLPKLLDNTLPLFFALGNLLKLIFHIGGEVNIHYLREASL